MSDYNKPNFLVLDTNASENWRRFRRAYELFLTASGLESVSSARKAAILLNFAGEAAQELIDASDLQKENKEDFEQVIKFFEDNVNPRVNVTFRFKFFSRSQLENESFEEFLAALQKLAKGCQFRDQEKSLIRDQIVIGVRDKTLQAGMLQESDLTLNKAIEMARIHEAKSFNVKQPESRDRKKALMDVIIHSNNSENRGNHDKSNGLHDSYDPVERKDNVYAINDQQEYRCKKCDSTHRRGNCPAYGQLCSNCGYQNHLAIGCKFRFKNNQPRDQNRESSKKTAYAVAQKQDRRDDGSRW